MNKFKCQPEFFAGYSKVSTLRKSDVVYFIWCMMHGTKGTIAMPGVYNSGQIRMTTGLDLKKMAEKRYSDIISYHSYQIVKLCVSWRHRRPEVAVVYNPS